ncbi:transposase family protein [Micromonospora sp. NPDC092111]|uniref:transposase family protein n=1 Tax=Micromonospora sp. NPDC092111 TaxID=3364289 RepID=UPI00380E88AC
MCYAAIEPGSAADGASSRRERQALLVLAHLRNGDTYTRLAAGFEVGLATVFRYVREAVDLLEDGAPSLTGVLRRRSGNGHHLGVLDGTWLRIDRLGGDLDRLYYSGRHHHHGVNLQGLVDPRRGVLGAVLRRAARLH